jgi:hypothetical protein
MGLDKRRTSGRLFNGSKLIVPGQPIASVKVFPNTFQYKKGTPKDTFREINSTPTPSPTPTPIVETYYILTESNQSILTEGGVHILY